MNLLWHSRGPQIPSVTIVASVNERMEKKQRKKRDAGERERKGDESWHEWGVLKRVLSVIEITRGLLRQPLIRG